MENNDLQNLVYCWRCFQSAIYHIDGQYQTVSASPFCPLCFCMFFFYICLFIFDCSWSLLLLTGFSLVVASGGYILVVVHVLPIAAASIIAEHGLQRCDTRAQLPHSMWDLPGQGIKPMSPALAGRFLTTGPPGKSCMFFKRVAIYPCICSCILLSPLSVTHPLALIPVPSPQIFFNIVCG